MKQLLLNVIAGWWSDPLTRALVTDVHHLVVCPDGPESLTPSRTPTPEGQFETVQLSWPASVE